MLDFRLIQKDEWEIIQSQLQISFNLTGIQNLIDPDNLIISEGRWKEVFLVTSNLREIFNEIRNVRNPYLIGLYFGDISEGHFRISLAGITEIAKYVAYKTVLTDQGEKKVLYGRNLQKKDIAQMPSVVIKGNLSILINRKEDVLALGKYLFNRQEIEHLEMKTIIIKNIIDKGWYLRKGK
ncbi:MAG: hypothetical protein ACTSRS_07975 [Candidatus Helarchaeota archaeon]